MSNSKIAIAYEGTFEQTDGQDLQLDNLGSSTFLPTHNDRLLRTSKLLRRITNLSCGPLGATMADYFGFSEFGSKQKPIRPSKKRELECFRNHIFGPFTIASGRILLKTAIDAAAIHMDESNPFVLDEDTWVSVAFSQEDTDNGEKWSVGPKSWFTKMTGENSPIVQRDILQLVCSAVVELPDFKTTQQLAFYGTLATMYRYDDTAIA